MVHDKKRIGTKSRPFLTQRIPVRAAFICLVRAAFICLDQKYPLKSHLLKQKLKFLRTNSLLHVLPVILNLILRRYMSKIDILAKYPSFEMNLYLKYQNICPYLSY